MIRTLKGLGLALVAIFALSAMAAAAASADEFKSESAPITFTGTQDGATNDVFTTTAGTAECNTATYHGTQSGTNATSVKMTATYANCTAFKFAGATVSMNTCYYTFTLIGTGTTGKTDIKCTTAGDSITITAVSLGTTKCIVHVPEQEITGITYTNIGAGATREVTIDMNANSITYTHTSGTGLGACTGAGTTVQHDGTFVGKEVVTGETDPGTTHTGVFVQ